MEKRERDDDEEVFYPTRVRGGSVVCGWMEDESFLDQ